MERRHIAAQRQLQMKQRHEAQQNSMVNNGVPPLKNGRIVSDEITSIKSITPGPDFVRRPPPRRRT
jgi:hypothetical protein